MRLVRDDLDQSAVDQVLPCSSESIGTRSSLPCIRFKSSIRNRIGIDFAHRNSGLRHAPASVAA
jgi:hypothetical protein